MTTDEFVTKYNGKGIDFDGWYGFQCMDLYQQYTKEVLEGSHVPANAYKVWDNYDTATYNKIDNTPEGVPRKGDVVIWNENTGGGYGHIAVFVEGDINSFKSFDQNWPVGSICHIQDHNYNNVTGWLRPKAVAQDDHADNLTKMLNWDSVVDYYNKTFLVRLDSLDKLGGKIISDKFEELTDQLIRCRASLNEETEIPADTGQPSVPSTGSGSPTPDSDGGDKDVQPRDIPSDTAGSDTPPIILPPVDEKEDKRDNPLKALLHLLKGWFKKLYEILP